MLAEWAAIAIDNARLYEDVERRRGELERAVRGLEATAAIARAVGFETDLERVLELIVKRGRALVDARSLLVLLDEDGDAARGAPPPARSARGVLGTALPVEGTLRRVRARDRRAAAARRAVEPAWITGSKRSPPAHARPLVVPLGFRGRAARRAGRPRPAAATGRRSTPTTSTCSTSFAASAAIAIATAQSVEAERLRHSHRGLRAGAPPLGARAARRDAPGARRAQADARGGAQGADAERVTRPSAQAVDQSGSQHPQPAEPDHRAAAGGARRARPQARARGAGASGPPPRPG